MDCFTFMALEGPMEVKNYIAVFCIMTPCIMVGGHTLWRQYDPPKRR